MLDTEYCLLLSRALPSCAWCCTSLAQPSNFSHLSSPLCCSGVLLREVVELARGEGEMQEG